MLELRGIRKSYGEVSVLDDINLDLAAGAALALTGESGSGKSTLLHLIAALDSADAGEIRISGRDVHTLDEPGRADLRRTQLSLVFQQFNLIPTIRVAENIAFQARLAGRHDAAWDAEIARRLGIDGLLARYPEEISGGQAQRVAIARALAARPPLLLADEPTGNLDEATGDAVLALMLELVRETQTALLFVTHSPRLAAMIGPRRHLTAGRLDRAA
ncbi:MAG: ABC transporter ATP-binding protein [Pseudomonadota bacterium]